MVNIIFFVVALLGAIMAFGPGLVQSSLTGIAGIDFISVSDLVVFGFMLLVMVAMVGVFAVYTNRLKRPECKTLRVVSIVVMVAVFVVYIVLLCSLWADAWENMFRNWTIENEAFLNMMQYVGWLCMVGSVCWFARAAYEYYRRNVRVVHPSGKGPHAASTDGDK